MLSKPLTLTRIQAGLNLITIDQLATSGSGISFFDLSAVFGQPSLMFLKQFQRPLDHFFRIVIRPGAQHFSNQPLLFRPQRNGHASFP